MTLTELKAQIALGEDSRRQFKRDVTNADSLAAEMAAFANSDGGVIFLGVADDGELPGLSRADVKRINQLIGNAASQHVRSPLTVQTENVAAGEGRVIIVLTVPKGQDRPYFDRNGVIWLKSGADKRRVNSKEELRRLFQSVDQFHADELPTKAGIDKLDKLRFRDFLRDVYKQEYPDAPAERLRLLQNLNLAADDGKLNLAGVLLFAEQPERIKPQFVLKAIRYPGNDIHSTRYLDTEDFSGPLRRIFEDSLAFIMRNLHKVQAGRGVNAPGTPEIPPTVFEELLVNALVHRDYLVSAPIRLFIFDNRIEIISPGHLPNNLTVEKIRTGNSVIRNPILVSYVAKGLLPYHGLGSGIKRALDDWPEIDFTDDRDGCLFTATVHRKEVKGSEKTAGVMGEGSLISSPISSPISSGKRESSPKTENQIMALVKQDASVSTKHLGEILDISKRAVLKQIKKLKDQGRLKRVRARQGRALGGYRMTFTEANTVEKMILDTVAPQINGEPSAWKEERAGWKGSLGSEMTKAAGRSGQTAHGVHWDHLPAAQLPRKTCDVMVEPWVRAALIRLNPDITIQPDRADEVIYNLRACILSVQADGLVRANENFTAWLRGEKTMPFGPNGEHVTVRLVDAVHPGENRLIVCNQWTWQAGAVEKRFDVVFLVNGLPVVIGEAKTPARSAVTWFDGAFQVNEIYERQAPAMFVPNVFSFATEGKLFRYGAVRMPIEMWGPWRDEENQAEGQLHHVQASVASMLRPEVVLDILQNFTLFATDKKHRRIKIICRYQQYFTTNQIVERVVKGYPKKGLIWHFQGSGKSLLMVFAAQKLRMHPRLGNPTVIIVVDRIDLDTQITATFNAADVPNMVGVATRQDLQALLGQDVRKVLITTIHKFAEAGGRLNERSNIIVMVDEAHRTQEGDLGRKMREALPNAFLFGLTGTPINRADKNTFWAFGADEDEKGYLSRYSFQDSIRDKATLPLHFEAPEVKLKIDKAAIDEAYAQITGNLSEQDRDDLAKRAAKMAVLVKNPERIRAVVNHIVRHFRTKVEPNGFKAQVVVFDRECCVLYKAVMDELIGPEASAIVMTGAQGDPPDWKAHIRDKDAEEKLLDRFRSPTDPLQFVIVTSKLLTGFDAPILQVMYLDKPMKDHNLLQAICRTNRTFGQEKTHGLIVDYIGIFDDVARALDFDEKAVQRVVSNIEELRKALPVQMQKCLAFFPGVDRSVGGYEGLMAAQQCLPNNEARDRFAANYIVLGTIWEALSPDPCLSPYESDYRWLTRVYESVKPPSGNGKLLWHALGAKTVELINENVHVESVRDDVETLVMDAQVLEEILKDAEPEKKAREIEIRLIARLRRYLGNPKFTALGERLEKIRERHEQGFLTSLEFLKAILEVAKEVLEAERDSDAREERDRAKEALTELFQEAKGKNTHIIVERIVADIDEIVKKVRFPDWQHTSQGERLVQKELRRTLLKYRLHTDQELFDKAYGYIRQYY